MNAKNQEIGFKIRNTDLWNFDKRWWSLYTKPFQYYFSCTDVLSARPHIQQKYEQRLFDQGISLFIGILHAHMEPHAVITYCPF